MFQFCFIISHFFTAFQTYDAKEREFTDSYGAPAAPVETSWGNTNTGGAFDTGYTNTYTQGGK